TDPAAAEEALTASIAGLGYPTLTTDTPDGDRRPDQDPVAVEFTWDLGDGEDDAAGGDGAGDDDEATTGASDTGGETADGSRTATTSGQAGTVKVDDQWKV